MNKVSCLCGCEDGRPMHRRSFLGGSAAALALAAASFSPSTVAFAQAEPSPDEALQRLLDGNARFVAHKMVSFDEDLTILKENTASKQEPFAAVLSCADSRVPIELIFDQSIGHIFVTRVAGNICTPEIIASLEYGAGVLGTKTILVMGHSGCGAVKAAAAVTAAPGQISALYAPIRPAVDRAGSDIEQAIKVNAQIQAGLLESASPLIAGLLKEKKIKIAAGYYNLADGRVSLLT